MKETPQITKMTLIDNNLLAIHHFYYESICCINSVNPAKKSNDF